MSREGQELAEKANNLPRVILIIENNINNSSKALLNQFKPIINQEILRKTKKKHETHRKYVLVVFIINITKRIAIKLRRIILFHFGLVTLRIHFRKARKLMILMFFGFGGRVHDSQNKLFLSLETTRDFKKSKKSEISFNDYNLGKCQNCEIRFLV